MLKFIGYYYFNLIFLIHRLIEKILPIKILIKNSVFLNTYTFPTSDLDISIIATNQKGFRAVTLNLYAYLVKILTPWFGEVSLYTNFELNELENYINPLEYDRDPTWHSLKRNDVNIYSKFTYLFHMLRNNNFIIDINSTKWRYHLSKISNTIKSYQDINTFFSSLTISPISMNELEKDIITNPTTYFYEKTHIFFDFINKNTELKKLIENLLEWQIVGLSGQLWTQSSQLKSELKRSLEMLYFLNDFKKCKLNISSLCNAPNKFEFYNSALSQYLCTNNTHMGPKDYVISHPLLNCQKCLNTNFGEYHRLNLFSKEHSRRTTLSLIISEKSSKNKIDSLISQNRFDSIIIEAVGKLDITDFVITNLSKLKRFSFVELITYKNFESEFKFFTHFKSLKLTFIIGEEFKLDQQFLDKISSFVCENFFVLLFFEDKSKHMKILEMNYNKKVQVLCKE